MCWSRSSMMVEAQAVIRVHSASDKEMFWKRGLLPTPRLSIFHHFIDWIQLHVSFFKLFFLQVLSLTLIWKYFQGCRASARGTWAADPDTSQLLIAAKIRDMNTKCKCQCWVLWCREIWELQLCPHFIDSSLLCHFVFRMYKD